MTPNQWTSLAITTFLVLVAIVIGILLSLMLLSAIKGNPVGLGTGWCPDKAIAKPMVD